MSERDPAAARLLWGKECAAHEALYSLIWQLRAWRIPEAWSFGGMENGQIIAYIRHRFTNYEEILSQLPRCQRPCDLFLRRYAFQYMCYCNLYRRWPSPADKSCPLRERAHDTLRSCAERLAQRTYDAWRKRERERRSAHHVGTPPCLEQRGNLGGKPEGPEKPDGAGVSPGQTIRAPMLQVADMIDAMAKADGWSVERTDNVYCIIYRVRGRLVFWVSSSRRGPVTVYIKIGAVPAEGSMGRVWQFERYDLDLHAACFRCQEWQPEAIDDILPFLRDAYYRLSSGAG